MGTRSGPKKHAAPRVDRGKLNSKDLEATAKLSAQHMSSTTPKGRTWSTLAAAARERASDGQKK